MIAHAINRIDRLNRRLGHAVAWLALAMVLLQFAVVLLRYVFAFGYVPMQEAVWHLHGALFMLGAGYTLLHDGHVRVDVIYRDAGPVYKARMDLAGCLFFILPVCALTVFVSWDYVLRSIYDFSSGTWVLEASPEFGGLPLIWAYKMVILVFAITLGLQAVSVAGKAFAYLSGAAPDYPPRPAGGSQSR